MVNYIQAIILGLVQGISELFPISSLGHSVIIPSLFGWSINQNGKAFLTFLVATHLATAIVLFIFFWHDWKLIFQGLWRSIKERRVARTDTYAKLGWLLVVGTIPAGIMGLLLEKKIEGALSSALLACIFLVINGFILLFAEQLKKRSNRRPISDEQSDRTIARLRYRQAVGIGTAQAAALIPGISRSGASMAGGLAAGLNNENAARFSFLLATPVIGLAALLKLPSLFSHSMASERGAILAGALAAALAAYVAVRFLVRYFQTKTLRPFAIYCLAAGVVYYFILVLR